MALSDSIKVRLREGQALVYAAQAEQRGVGIAAFIRDRLDRIDRVEEELASIRAAMIDMGETLDELRVQAEKQPVASAYEKQAIEEPDVTPVFHPAATRDRPLLSRRSADEATGGFKPARCFSSSAAKAVGVA